ncbi:MAG: hypothetical protein ACREJB_05840 [Planctomycetaceae bacterium]
MVRVSELGELNVYTIYEHELDQIAQGSPNALDLNFALALLPVSLTLIITLLTVTIESDRVFLVFVSVAVISFIAGLFLLVRWWKNRRSVLALVQEIKNRLPPPEAIQEELQQK